MEDRSSNSITVTDAKIEIRSSSLDPSQIEATTYPMEVEDTERTLQTQSDSTSSVNFREPVITASGGDDINMSVDKSNTISTNLDGYETAPSQTGSMGEEDLPDPMASTPKKEKEGTLEEEKVTNEDSLDDFHNTTPAITD